MRLPSNDPGTSGEYPAVPDTRHRSIRASQRGTVATAVAALLGSSLVVLPALPTAAQQILTDPALPRTLYVDCSAEQSGDGSASAPLNNLDEASSISLAPGDSLLFHRGSTCRGTLTVTGSGTARLPIRISDYGDVPDRAVIDGNGGSSAIVLDNMEHVELSNLEVTNANNPGTTRTGVRVEARDTGVRSGITIRKLFVHDILGDDSKWTDGSQGIGFVVRAGDVPTRFENISVIGNVVERVDRQGIQLVASDYGSRPEEDRTSDKPRNWLASTSIRIAHNVVRDVGGDGIVLNATDGAIVERNTVTGFQRRSAGYNAGIWAYNADNSVFQYNDVSGGETHRDGMAYDIDQGNIGTTFRYNYSHDNEGGAFLICQNGPGTIRDGLFHDNWSTNDSYRGVENCSGAVESAAIDHNTFYIGDGVSQTVIQENVKAPRAISFTNNRVTKEGDGTAGFSLLDDGYTFAGNTFTGVIGAPVQNREAGAGACAPGAVVPSVLSDLVLTDADGNAIGIRPGADTSAVFGAYSSFTIDPNQVAEDRLGCF
ncbi:right-handed parallel beta-helix repeat-containing protein [Devriesea agamarum]|uniref:right-handed parallel beta-helix repeat-containing protein n=1 Tax=Devriesea agamarum TaxID=472569 RepID=UPI0012ED4050|nr:right-handed parallel beta-helix repeat-containing protein [Devriesea agamarum]